MLYGSKSVYHRKKHLTLRLLCQNNALGSTNTEWQIKSLGQWFPTVFVRGRP